ncbi:MAG: glycosyltransferase family 1 protein, partial [Bacteroidetes bacterium]
SVLVKAPHKLLWDQVAIPLAVKREKIELLFHPKHSLPFFVKCKTLMHLRGSDYWIFPDHFEKFDLMYQKLTLPIFCKKATHLVVESNFVKQDFKRILKIPESKMTMIYLAPSDRFKVITDKKKLSEIQKKYNLPEEFILTVTRIVQGKKYYAGKNFVNIIKGFQESQASQYIKFVVVGLKTKEFIRDLKLPPNVQRNIVALDFVPQEDLPALYNLASFFLFPSRYESFGIPLAEAMRCGCPVITSNTFACPEIVGDAGLLVNPENISEIAGAIDRLHTDVLLRNELRKKGFEQVERFSWEKSAKQHIQLFEQISREDVIINT